MMRVREGVENDGWEGEVRVRVCVYVCVRNYFVCVNVCECV